MMLDEMPAKMPMLARRAKTRLQVMRVASNQVARRVDNRGQEQRVPGRLPLLMNRVRARLQRQGQRGIMTMRTEQNVGIIRISHGIDIRQSNSSLAQAIIDGMKGEFVGRKGNRSLAMLHMGKTLFLGSSQHHAILYKAGSRIVVGCIYAQGIHAR